MRKQMRMRKIILATALVVMIISVTTLPAIAAQDTMQSKVLSYFQKSATWTPSTKYTNPQYDYLNWDLNNNIGLKKINIGNIDGCTVGTGDCASFVEAVCPNNVKTKYWKQGIHVLDGKVKSGTAIATLNKNGYISGGHSAIFVSYSYTNGKITGFLVWDQKYHGDKAIGRHILKNGASTYNSNANNYYVIQV
jgi:hypothetical protein